MKMKVLLRNNFLPVLFCILILCLSNYSGIKGDIKSDIGQCTTKETTHNSLKETCHIKFTEDRSIKYIKKLQRKTSKTCKIFKRSDYNKSSPSHVYMEAYGEIGNQLTAYAILYQLSLQAGVHSFMDYDMKKKLSKIFTPKSIKVPVLYDTYCNPTDIPWEMWRGKLDDLILKKRLQKGKFFWLYKPIEANPKGYREELHLGKERENFVSSYIRSVRKTLKFYPNAINQVDETLDKVASSKDIQRDKLTYIGIHNRRTDHLEYWENFIKTFPFKSVNVSNKKYQELGKEYFLEAMNYFRNRYENTVFIYVSDDMLWGKTKLKGVKDLHFLGLGQNGSKTDGVDLNTAAHDLLLLTKCNYTILSRGTFSLWAAYLNGGGFYIEEKMYHTNRCANEKCAFNEDTIYKTEALF